MHVVVIAHLVFAFCSGLWAIRVGGVFLVGMAIVVVVSGYLMGASVGEGAVFAISSAVVIDLAFCAGALAVMVREMVRGTA